MRRGELTNQQRKGYTMTTQGKKITITNSQQDGTEYTTDGVLLDDGRLLTYGTGVDGRDSLWASVKEYEPNGSAEYLSHDVSDEVVSVSADELRDADKDSVVYSDKSLLTPEERAASTGRLDPDWVADCGPNESCGNTLTDWICRAENCETAEVDRDGQVWIEGPMAGHWLSQADCDQLQRSIEAGV